MSGNPAPAIGVTTRHLAMDSLLLDVVERAYAEAITSVGGIPRLLPCTSGADARQELVRLDGLVFTGGGDIDPKEYGMVPSEAIGGVDRERDYWEFQLVNPAIEAGLPILGICRGCQVLNVALGGTLVQHLPSHTHLPHLTADREKTAHPVRIRPATQLYGIEHNVQIEVNSVHHQAVHRLGADVLATAWAPDGTIEAVERQNYPAIGVQWHPENLLHERAHVALFSWVVSQAQTRIGHGPDRTDGFRTLRVRADG